MIKVHDAQGSCHWYVSAQIYDWGKHTIVLDHHAAKCTVGYVYRPEVED